MRRTVARTTGRDYAGAGTVGAQISVWLQIRTSVLGAAKKAAARLPHSIGQYVEK